MLLADLVATAATVASTRSRLAKVDALATLLGRLAPDEVIAATGYLVGDLPQGRIGIGWATIRDLDVTPATEPTLTIDDVARAVDAVRDSTGAGSVRARREILEELFTRRDRARGRLPPTPPPRRVAPRRARRGDDRCDRARGRRAARGRAAGRDAQR